ncbi:hypothetical protein OESDEN_10834 [Oesophagostomum dentatum]|uniref:Uncharacterized protein n=1 Tax=Oesophagostomum dentatum TaxID=61180 RepID=A0A0B1SWJ1_OESDE|nr:hypothetical protein OESDEN_10834 [Oesophagostomum dentatum]
MFPFLNRRLSDLVVDDILYPDQYLVLPIAAVVGTIGWYLEKKYRPGSWSKPVPYLNSSIQEQREKRQTSQPTADPHAEPAKKSSDSSKITSELEQTDSRRIDSFGC